MNREPLDFFLWEAISAAAVVRYARCFSSGAREPLEHDLLKSASNDLQLTHEYMIAVRSKHVAHSVNAFEENDVTITVREEGDSLEITGVGVHSGRVIGLSFGDPMRLKIITEWVKSCVAEEISAERIKVLEAAKLLGAPTIKANGMPVAGVVATHSIATRGRSKP